MRPSSNSAVASSRIVVQLSRSLARSGIVETGRIGLFGTA